MRHALSNAPRNAIPYLALLLVLAVGVGCGYAFAANNNKTITVCADKKTGILHLKTRGRCKKSQTRVAWNQQGPTGPQGAQGAQGAAGAQGMPGAVGAQGPAGVSVWAEVAATGQVVAGHGLSVQHVSGTGTYQVTVTDQTCADGSNAPVVTLSDGNPPNGQSAGAFPVGWFEASLNNQQFTVFTGVVAAGSFATSDRTFDLLDTCQ